jgi:uncharacterized protein (TIGR02300 family)
VAKAEWGTKRLCPNCGTRYYDMRHDPIVCPHCGSPFDPEALLKTRRTRAVAPAVTDADEEIEPDLGGEEVAEPVIAAVALGGEEADADEAEEADTDDVEADEDEEDDELPEDASELGEDEDDMAEVIENVDEDDE